MFLSIIIANYNYGRFIEEAILSVLNQKTDEIELIIIDGGSSDNSLEIIKKYEDNIAYWISEPDKGQSDAFNKGFGKAKGEYLTWLNADDFLMPNSLSKIIQVIKKQDKNYKWFSADTIFINNENKIGKCYCGLDYSHKLLLNGNIEVGGPSSFFHKDLFKKCGNFDLNMKFSMDTDLWERFVNKGYVYKHINIFCWVFRIHEDSKTSYIYTQKPKQNVLDEYSQRMKKNNKIIKKEKLVVQKIKKCLFSYHKSLFYTTMLKNKNINSVKL